MSYIAMTYIVMAKRKERLELIQGTHIVTAYVGMSYIAMTYIVMAKRKERLEIVQGTCVWTCVQASM